MKFRRTVGALLLVGLLGILFPASGQAGIFSPLQFGPDSVEPGLIARVLDWVQVVLPQLGEVFVAQEGAAMGTGG